jgi:hypothetical protein
VNAAVAESQRASAMFHLAAEIVSGKTEEWARCDGVVNIFSPLSVVRVLPFYNEHPCKRVSKRSKGSGGSGIRP